MLYRGERYVESGGRPWYLFDNVGRYAKALLRTRGEDDRVVDVEIARVLRTERWAYRLRFYRRFALACLHYVEAAWKRNTHPRWKKLVEKITKFSDRNQAEAPTEGTKPSTETPTEGTKPSTEA